MNTGKKILEDKIRGSLYAFAIGDAMGATTEFMIPAQIKSRYDKVTDIIGGGWLDLEPGQVTDDTQMSMCVMEALKASNNDYDTFMNKCSKNFINWLNGGPKDVGGQCSRAIQYAKQNYNPDEDIDIRVIMQKGARGESALGNGSLMRAMPCALYGSLEFNVGQGSLTHNNNTCYDYIEKYNKIIMDGINGKCVLLPPVEKMEPTGCVINTFNNACYWIENTDNVKDAIIGAVNDGGDADTIAAITGSIAGAMYGFSSIPERWVEQLDKNVKKNLEDFSNFLLKTIYK